MSRKGKLAWPLGLALILMLALTACHRTPDETQIRQAIGAAQQAAEQADAGLLGDQLADDFVGADELADRSHLLNLLRLARLRGETIHALIGPIDVEPNSDRYTADFTVTLTSGGRLLPAQMGVYKVQTAWRRVGRHWRCYSAQWTRQL